MALIVACLMLILSLIPAGIKGSKLSEDSQIAMAWSRQLLAEAPTPQSYPIHADLALSHHKTKVLELELTATRTIEPAGPYLHRVEVTTEWPNGKTPMKLGSTRFSPVGSEK